jgi:hypothetical protein
MLGLVLKRVRRRADRDRLARLEKIELHHLARPETKR